MKIKSLYVFVIALLVLVKASAAEEQGCPLDEPCPLVTIEMFNKNNNSTIDEARFYKEDLSKLVQTYQSSTKTATNRFHVLGHETLTYPLGISIIFSLAMIYGGFQIAKFSFEYYRKNQIEGFNCKKSL